MFRPSAEHKLRSIPLSNHTMSRRIKTIEKSVYQYITNIKQSSIYKFMNLVKNYYT